MHEGDAPVRVNFARPFPIFPLDTVVLLPHATIRLYIFEPRYRQLVSHILDSNGQFALAVFDGDAWKHHYEGSPPIRRAVCVGQIVRHEGFPDGTAKIWVRGLCRASIVDEHEPDADRLYRTAQLRPFPASTPADHQIDPGAIELILGRLRQRPLGDLPAVRGVLERVQATDDAQTPTDASAVLDLVSLGVLAGLGDRDLLYEILATPDPAHRTGLVVSRLEELRSILHRVDLQFDADAPFGVSWN